MMMPICEVLFKCCSCHARSCYCKFSIVFVISLYISSDLMRLLLYLFPGQYDSSEHRVKTVWCESSYVCHTIFDFDCILPLK
jgi:hypothetical protein